VRAVVFACALWIDFCSYLVSEREKERGGTADEEETGDEGEKWRTRQG